MAAKGSCRSVEGLHVGVHSKPDGEHARQIVPSAGHAPSAGVCGTAGVVAGRACGPLALASRLELAPHCPEARAAWRSQYGCSECHRNFVSTVCLHDTQQPPVMGPHFVTHTSQVRTTAAEESPQSQEWQREHSLRLPARKLGAQPVDALGGLSLLSRSHGSSAVSPLAALAAAVSPATCRALSAAGL